MTISVAILQSATGIAPASFKMQATVSGGLAPYSIVWDYGDGGTDSGNTVSHTYTLAGTYKITVKVTDSVGQTASGSATVQVNSPAVSYVPPPSVSVPLPSSVVIGFTDGTSVTAQLVPPSQAVVYWDVVTASNLQALYNAGSSGAGKTVKYINDGGGDVTSWDTLRATEPPPQPNGTNFPLGVLFVTPDNARYGVNYSPSYIIGTTPPSAPVGNIWYVLHVTYQGHVYDFQTQSKSVADSYLEVLGGGMYTDIGKVPNLPVVTTYQLPPYSITSTSARARRIVSVV